MLAVRVIITKNNKYSQLLNSNNVLILNNVISVKETLKLVHAKRGVFRTAKLSLRN